MYELIWKGIATGTVEKMRSPLTLARQMDRTIELLTFSGFRAKNFLTILRDLESR